MKFKIKEVREILGIKRTQMAKDLNVKATSIWNLEKDMSLYPDWNLLKKMSNYLGIDFLDVLIGYGYMDKKDIYKAQDMIKAEEDLKTCPRKFILETRRKKKLSLNDIEFEIGISHATISRFENRKDGKSLNLFLVSSLAMVLDISATYLLALEGVITFDELHSYKKKDTLAS